jgi:hypothetical protein
MQRARVPRPRYLLLALVFAGCGGPATTATPAHEHPEPISAQEHEVQAKEHEALADESSGNVEVASTGGDQVQCVDIGGPLESGGERMPVMKPCWTRAEQNTSYLRAAEAHRRAAADHREWAHLLIEVEKEACSGLGEIERKTSPFVRGPDILSVEPYNEGKTLRGARVTFRKVQGLSKPWLVKSMSCHRARAAKLGFAQDFMPHCPLTLKDTATSVVETPDTVVVTLRSTDPIVATEIYGRALYGASDDAKPSPDATKKPSPAAKK